MIAEIKKSVSSGTVYAPTSKSVAHRLMISAALADGTSVISGISASEDVLATAECLAALGAKIEISGNVCTVCGCDMRKSKPTSPLFCRESGSTLRFLIPVAALSACETAFTGSDRLFERPLGIYEEIFSQKELTFVHSKSELLVKGPLTHGNYKLRGDVSSQFITGLLFALPLLDGDSTIEIIPPFESRPYVDLTLSALREFGIKLNFDGELLIKIPGNQKYTPKNLSVEGDYSGTAFIEALNMVGGKTEILGLSENSLQGDRVYREIYPLLSCGTPTVDISDCPDLAPILFTLAAYFNGATFTGTARLKAKESDRAAVMAEELRKFGADIEISDNSVTVRKTQLRQPSVILSGHNDHRVVMSLAVLLSVFGGKIEGAEAVKKSYPDFFRDIKSIGIDVTLYE